MINKNVAEKIVKSLLPVKGEILEIGPGRGILTDLLVKFNEGNKLLAVELDKELSQQIRLNYNGHIEVINRSILDLILDEICGPENLNIIGNVPYYISREIIDWIIFQNKKIARCVLMMQKEFVDKILPGGDPRKSGPQTLILNYLYRTEKLFEVNPGSFSPMPKVRSTVFSLVKKEDPGDTISIPEFYLFLKECFKNRRKTLLNNLSATAPAEKLWDILEQTRINPKKRAEELNLSELLEFFKELQK